MAGTDYKLRIKGQDQTGKAFGKVNKNINSTQSAMKKLAGAFAGAFAIRQIVQFGNEALQVADSIGKTAVAVGVTAEFLQRYQFAAQQAGVETEKFNKALKFFSKGIGEAAQGRGLAKIQFDELGISIFEAGGKTKTAEKLFVETFKALEKVGSESEKSANLAGLFGSKMVDLKNISKDGAAAMQELAASATGIFSNETIAQAELFNDTMNRLRRQVLVPLQAVFISLATHFLDTFEAMGLITAEEKGLTLVTYDLQKAKEDLVKAEENLSKFRGRNAKTAKADVLRLKEEIPLLEAKQENLQKEAQALQERKLAREKDDEAIKNQIRVVENFSNTVEGQLTNSFKKFFDFTNAEFLNFGNLAKSVLNQVINEVIRLMIIAPLVKTITGTITGGLSNVFPSLKLPSGDGGGFTGSGGRVGGLDGRGGFMAMLHPNETVIDHTKGQGMGTTVNFNINTVDATGFDQLLVSRKGTITQIINNAMNNQGKMGVV
jgi:hypothetical protein